MNIDEVLSQPLFSKISAEQRESLKALAEKLNNKTVAEAMPIMLAYMAKAPKLVLSKAEQAAMTEAVIECLNEKDRAKFRAMLSLSQK